MAASSLESVFGLCCDELHSSPGRPIFCPKLWNGPFSAGSKPSAATKCSLERRILRYSMESASRDLLASFKFHTFLSTVIAKFALLVVSACFVKTARVLFGKVIKTLMKRCTDSALLLMKSSTQRSLLREDADTLLLHRKGLLLARRRHVRLAQSLLLRGHLLQSRL